jgi:hypothetical protein
MKVEGLDVDVHLKAFLFMHKPLIAIASKVSLSLSMVEEAIKSISDWMGETEGEIRKYLDTMDVMDEYLEYLEYDGIYTQLDSREDQFLSLTKWLKTFYGETSKRAFDGYTDGDVDDLKILAFDYLRFRNEYDGKEFRNIAEGNQENHFFGNKEIWKSFLQRHNEIIKNLPKEDEIDFNSTKLEEHLNARDNIFFENSKFGGITSSFIDNLNYHKTSIEYNRAAEAPEKNIKNAHRAFDAIKQNHKNFSKPEIQNMVKELGDRIFNSLQKKSPSRVLTHIIELLEGIDVDKIPDEEIEEVQEKTKRIQQIVYQINKNI